MSLGSATEATISRLLDWGEQTLNPHDTAGVGVVPQECWLVPASYRALREVITHAPAPSGTQTCCFSLLITGASGCRMRLLALCQGCAEPSHFTACPRHLARGCHHLCFYRKTFWAPAAQGGAGTWTHWSSSSRGAAPWPSLSWGPNPSPRRGEEW